MIRGYRIWTVRVSTSYGTQHFFGGGTDYPSGIEKTRERFLSTAIYKYCHITARYLPPVFLISTGLFILKLRERNR
jgi:D-glycero-alpha-D-manno-heptose-7-phosphate kinase